MAVVSDSKTASEMRLEFLQELERQYEIAKRRVQNGIDPETRLRKKSVKIADLQYDTGYSAALRVQLDFWQRVWVEGKQALVTP